MKKLKAIGVGSVFRLSLILGAVAGVLVGFVLMVMDLIDHRFLEGVVTLLPGSDSLRSSGRAGQCADGLDLQHRCGTSWRHRNYTGRLTS